MPSIVKLTLESNQYEKGIKNAQKSLNEFTRAVGINAKALSGMAVAGAAVTTALKVAKDAFSSSRDMVDEWGRTIQSAQSIYDGFLNALNTGDFSGFINNMGRITQAAREAYDAISDLQLYNAFNGPNMADARTGLTEAIADFRSGTGSKEDVKAAGEVLKKELDERRKREYDAYEKFVKEEAAKVGVDAKKLIGALKGNFQDFENLMHSNLPESYTKKTIVPSWGSGTVAGLMSGVNFSTRQSVAPGTDDEILSDFARRVTPETLQKLQQYSVQAKQTANEIASTDKMIARILNRKDSGSGGGGGKGGSDTKTELTELQQNQKTINDLTQEYVKLGDLSTEEARNRQEEIQKEIQLLQQRNGILGLRAEQAKGRMLLNASDVDLSQRFNGGSFMANPFASDMKAIETGGLKLTLDSSTMKTVMDQINKSLPKKNEVSMTKELGNIAGGIGSIVGGIESLGVEIPEGMKSVIGGMQTMIGILSGIASIVTAIEAISTANLFKLAGGGVVHAAGGWSGMVPGTAYSGDNVPALLNSGELVLNQFQQQALAANLNGGGMQNMHLTGSLQGEDILVSINRVGRRKGYGEVCFFKE